MEHDHEKPDVYRGRFLQIAGGSARECGAILDILYRCGVLDREAVRKGKDLLVRIVAMLTRMIEHGNQVREDDIVYGYVNGNGNGNGCRAAGRARLLTKTGCAERGASLFH